MGHEDPQDKENISRLVNLGHDFERFTSESLKERELLVVGDIPAGLLSTNENANFADLKKRLGVTADGYIYGVGAGNIFSLPLLFDHDVVPKAILSVDLLPEAVLSGRAVVNFLRSSDNFENFVKKLQSRDAFDASVTDVIQSETSQELREVFQRVDSSKLFDLLERSVWQIPNTGIVQSGRYKDTISVVAAIRENWSILKQLAEENNIGFGLADYFDTSVMNWLKKQPGFSSSRNVIYSSNLIDYPSASLDQKAFDPRWLSFMNALIPLDNSGNIFIFTTKENDFELYAMQGISKHAPKDFWLI